MESSPSVSYKRSRPSHVVESFIFPPSTDEFGIARSLENLSKYMISSYSDKSPTFQHKNYRSFIWMIKTLIQLFESVGNLGPDRLSPTAVTCFNELYILLYQVRYLLKYCLESRRLTLLLLNSMVSRHFHTFNREILCVLDVIPLQEMRLSEDVAELVQLLRDQMGRRKIFIDPKEEELKLKIFGFHDDLEVGKVPDHKTLQQYFAKELGILDKRTFRSEIESLEALTSSNTEEVDVPQKVLKSFIGLMCYGELLIYGFQEEEMETDDREIVGRNKASQTFADTFVTMPTEFSCPISHELMTDPITLATGHTFDRNSIMKWFDKGSLECPITRTSIRDGTLIPNKAIQNLISMWCATQGITYGKHPREVKLKRRRMFPEETSTRALVEVTKATTKLLLRILSQGSGSAKRSAMTEIRLFSASTKQICLDIVSAGGIRILADAIKSEDDFVQVDAAISLFNLSAYQENKTPILEARGCIKSILNIARSGHTDQARDYATATIHNLSTEAKNSRKLAKTGRVATTLVTLVNEGSTAVRKNAIKTLRNLSALEENLKALIKAGSAKALAEALWDEELRKIATDILADLVKKPQGAKKIRKETSTVLLMTDILEWGTPSEKESVIRALIMFFKHGGSKGMISLAKNPSMQTQLSNVLQMDDLETRSQITLFLRIHEQLHGAQSETYR